MERIEEITSLKNQAEDITGFMTSAEVEDLADRISDFLYAQEDEHGNSEESDLLDSVATLADGLQDLATAIDRGHEAIEDLESHLPD